MRVIAGKFRGRKLTSFQAKHIRPTTDMVKESIFNKLQMHIPEAEVLDLYAGTGSLSVECVSRGASSVVAVEKHPKSVAIIRKNIELLKIEEIAIRNMDVFSYLKSATANSFDLVLVDPPFTQKLADSSMEALAKSQVVRPGGLVVVESSAHENISDQYSGLELLDRKDFGDKFVSFFKKDD